MPQPFHLLDMSITNKALARWNACDDLAAIPGCPSSPLHAYIDDIRESVEWFDSQNLFIGHAHMVLSIFFHMTHFQMANNHKFHSAATVSRFLPWKLPRSILQHTLSLSWH